MLLTHSGLAGTRRESDVLARLRYVSLSSEGPLWAVSILSSDEGPCVGRSDYVRSRKPPGQFIYYPHVCR